LRYDDATMARMPLAVQKWLATYYKTIGRKGGLARKDSLTRERRREIAQQAAKTRWEKPQLPKW
jgi:hypothetical protein